MPRNHAPVFLLVGIVFSLASGADWVCAQTPYGAGTAGSGGVTPRLASGTPWLGNAAMGYVISGARGGSLAAIGFSRAPGSTMVAGTEIFLSTSPQDLIFVDTLALSGPPGVPGSGSGFYPTPLNLASMPAFAGIDVFVQAIMLDDFVGGAFAATQALHEELRLSPLAFVGTQNFGVPSEHFFVDPAAATLAAPPGLQTPNASDAEFVEGGTSLFVTAEVNGVASILRADTTVIPPSAWTTFFAATGGAVHSLEYDPIDRILYALADVANGHREILALAADPAAANFGQLIGQTTTNGLLDDVRDWGLSRLPRVAALASRSPLALTLVDLEPTSATYLGVVTTTPVNQSPPASNAVLGVVDADISSDGRLVVVSLAVLGFGGIEIARYDVTSGSWIDHNPMLPGTQNLGSTSAPSVSLPSLPRSAALSDAGDFLIVGTNGVFFSPDVFRIAMPRTGQASWTVTNLGFSSVAPFFTLVSAIGIAPDERQVAVCTTALAIGGAPPTPAVYFLDPATGFVLGQVPTPTAASPSIVAWR